MLKVGDDDKSLIFGFEIEFERPMNADYNIFTSKATKVFTDWFKEHIPGFNCIYHSDGGGCEVASPVMTENWWRENKTTFIEFFEEAKKLGSREFSNSAGIHVTVNQDQFTVIKLINIMSFACRNAAMLDIIANRRTRVGSHLAESPLSALCSITSILSTWNSIENRTATVGINNSHGGNNTPKTIEFRWFNSTTNYHRFCAQVDLILLLTSLSETTIRDWGEHVSHLLRIIQDKKTKYPDLHLLLDTLRVFEVFGYNKNLDTTIPEITNTERNEIASLSEYRPHGWEAGYEQTRSIPIITKLATKFHALSEPWIKAALIKNSLLPKPAIAEIPKEELVAA